jgi:hypothetical protein
MSAARAASSRLLLCAVLAGAAGACTPVTGREPRDAAAPAFDPGRFEPAPGATGVDPAAPIVLPFASSSCVDCPFSCDVDPSSVEGRLTLSPPPLLPPSVALDPEACALRVQVPGGLRPAASQRVVVAGGLRDVFGNESASETVLEFTTGEPADPDRTPPVFVGSWPAEGDDRVHRRAPVTFYFSEEVVAPAIATGAPGLLQRTKPSSWALELLPSGGWTPGEQVLTVSRVADRAGNASEQAVSVRFVVSASEDAAPPAFAGLAGLEAHPDGLRLRWEAATDDRSPVARIRYLVYLGPAGAGPGPLPWLVTAPGRTEVVIARPAGPLEVRVRAQDEAGNVDANELVRVSP